MVWWRFGQAKDGTTPEEEAEGTARTLSAPAICVAAVVEVRREGSRGSTGFLSSFSGFLSSFGEGFK